MISSSTGLGITLSPGGDFVSGGRKYLDSGITPDAVAHPPVKEGQGAVDHRGGVTPSVGDELPEILY